MGTKMREAVDQYIDFRVRRNPTGAIKDARNLLIRMAEDWDATNRSPKSIDYIWIEEWLIDRQVKKTTLGAYESHLTGFFKWAESRGIVKTGWAWTRMGSSGAKTDHQFLYLSRQFFEEVLESEPSWYFRGLLATAMYTLGRGSEIRDLRLMHVRMSDGLIAFARRKTHDYDDMMPMCAELRDELSRYLAEYARLYPEMRDSWYLFPAARNAWGPGRRAEWTLNPTKRRYELAGTVKERIERNLDPQVLADNPDILKGEGGHTIRRSMARNLYESWRAQGVTDPLEPVRAMLGHSNRLTTERYIGLDTGRQIRNQLLHGKSFWPTPSAGADSADVVDIAAMRGRAADA